MELFNPRVVLPNFVQVYINCSNKKSYKHLDLPFIRTARFLQPNYLALLVVIYWEQRSGHTAASEHW